MSRTDNFFDVETTKEYQSAVGSTAALIAGAGTSTTPMADGGVSSKNFFGYWTKTTAASASRQWYLRHYFGGAAGGEVIRAWATIDTTGAAASSTVNGIHASVSLATSATLSGAANGIRATVSAAAETRTLTGTAAALQLDSDIGANNTVPWQWAFIRVTDSSSVRLTNFMNFPAASNGTIFAAHTTQTMTHSIKFIDAAGTAYYIMCTNAATNRS